MNKRILLAGLLGGIIVFAWGAIAHMVLPLGEVGIKELPGEEAILAAMRASIQQPGFYFFPGMGGHGESDPAAMKLWEEKYKQGPYGILIYHPAGTTPLSPAQLGTELVLDIVGALLAAWLLAQAAAGLANFGARALFVAVLGLFAASATHVSHWNWYGFPGDYTVANVASDFIGWALGGLALAGLLKRSS